MQTKQEMSILKLRLHASIVFSQEQEILVS
jgi:hypothetical protein